MISNCLGRISGVMVSVFVLLEVVRGFESCVKTKTMKLVFAVFPLIDGNKIKEKEQRLIGSELGKCFEWTVVSAL